LTAVRRHGFAIGLILLVALALRVAWLLYVHPDPVPAGRFDDTAWYRVAAHYVANGDGYVNPYTGTPTAAWPPGYPVFLGAVFKAFGEGVYQTGAANIALALATIVVVYAIGLRLFDRPTAIVAAAALALWPGQVFYSSLALSEPLFTFLFASAVLLLVAMSSVGRTRGRVVVVAAFGLAVALATLTRGQALVLLPAAVVVWGLAAGRWKAAIGWGMLAAFVTAAVLAPWVMRNEQKLGSPVIIATNMGPNVWIGHHEGASGKMYVEGGALPQPDHNGLTQPQIEVQADHIALRKGLGYMLTHPREELRLSAVKVRALYDSDDAALDWNAGFQSGYYGPDPVERGLRDAANAFWFGALMLAGAGLLGAMHRRRDAFLLLPMLLLTWTVTHLLFFGDPRFHYPIVFVVALLAARGAVVVLEAARRPLPGFRKKGYATA
jgi:4-amino-4-deoxy-L-arabinose transferase-like glycosyltransferase